MPRAAPFVMAAAGGLFGAEALAVTTNIASGSLDAIARVAAGTSDFALVDINALMRFRDKDKQGGARIKAVFVLSNKAPYAIIARKSRGVRALTDIEGENSSASPKATSRSGCGPRWPGRTASTSRT